MPDQHLWILAFCTHCWMWAVLGVRRLVTRAIGLCSCIGLHVGVFISVSESVLLQAPVWCMRNTMVRLISRTILIVLGCFIACLLPFFGDIM